MSAKLSTEQWRASVPTGMKALARWVGHRSKRPVDARSGAPASTTDPDTWATFEEAAEFYDRTQADPQAGVGFVFKEGDGLVFIDLDHIFDGAKLTKDGTALLGQLREALGRVSEETYAEVSPSGTGLHVFGIGRLGDNVRHTLRVGDAAVEVYDRARFATVTGQRFGKGQLNLIQNRVDALSVHLGRVEAPADEAPEPQRAQEAADALSHLDPDMPYADWLKVGMALKSGLGEAGRSLWLAWSAEGQKCKPGEPEEKWASFRRGGVGFGSLLFMAHAAGWEREGRAPSAQEEFTPVEDDEDEQEDGLRIVPLSTVERQHIDWLWKGRIALGHVSLIAGDPGRGKSIVSLDLAARLSRGELLPGETVQRRPGRVLLLNVEDGQADTLRPRAEAAGADLSRVLVLDLMHGGRPPQLPDDIGRLEAIIKAAGDVDLVVLDPLNACIPVRLDAHKDQHVRQALAPLAAMAQRLHVAVVLVVHLNKANDTVSALYRVSGSIGIGAAARSVLFVGPDPDDEDRRVVVQAKPQLGPPPPGLAFTVKPSPSDPEVGVVEWLGETEVEADQLVAKPEGGRGHSKLEQAKQWLSTFLQGGPQKAKDVLDSGKLMGFGEKTLRHAHDQLGGQRSKDGLGCWVWGQPPRFAEQPAGGDLL